MKDEDSEKGVERWFVVAVCRNAVSNSAAIESFRRYCRIDSTNYRAAWRTVP